MRKIHKNILQLLAILLMVIPVFAIPIQVPDGGTGQKYLTPGTFLVGNGINGISTTTTITTRTGIFGNLTATNTLISTGTTSISYLNKVIVVDPNRFSSGTLGIRQAVQLACSMGGGFEIYVPAGQYVSNTSGGPDIDITCPNIWIRGAGASSTIIYGGHVASGTSKTVIRENLPTANDYTYGNIATRTVANITISDLTIDASTTVGNMAFQTGAADEVHLRNLRILGPRIGNANVSTSSQPFGVYFGGPLGLPANGYAWGANDPVLNRWLDFGNSMENCTFEQDGVNGTVDNISWSYQGNSRFINNTVRGRLAYFRNADSIVTGNVFDGSAPSGNGILASGSTVNNLFSGNIFRNRASGLILQTAVTHATLYSPDVNQDNTISFNQFNNTSAGISFSGFGGEISTSTNNKILGNTFKGIYLNGGTASVAIRVGQASSTTVLGNNIEDSAIGVKIQDNSTNNTVCNNNISVSSSTMSILYGVRIETDSFGNFVCDNSIVGYSTNNRISDGGWNNMIRKVTLGDNAQTEYIGNGSTSILKVTGGLLSDSATSSALTVLAESGATGTLYFYRTTSLNSAKLSVGPTNVLTTDLGGTTRSMLDNTGLRIVGDSGASTTLDLYRTTTFVGTRIVSTPNSGIAFFNNNSLSSPKLFIDSTGNIGVGTTSPQSKFVVIGTANITATSVLATTTITSLTASNTIVNNYLSVGTTTNGYALTVVGTSTNIAWFTGASSTGCAISSTGIISCTSDINLKKNIENITYGLNTLLELQPKVFNWKFENDNSPKKLGFIAQQVNAIVPELVSIDVKGNYQLNTIGIIPIIVKAIQDVVVEIVKLDTRVYNLELRQTLSESKLEKICSNDPALCE